MSSRRDLLPETQELVEGVSIATRVDTLKVPLALHEPYISAKTARKVATTLRSGFVSSVGEEVNKFESSLANFCGVEHCVSTSSGTSALQLALKIVGVEPGNHVLVPAMSFVATANAVSFLGAIPVFLDSVELTAKTSLGISAESLDSLLEQYYRTSFGPVHKLTNARIGAIVPMHALGRLVDLSSIRMIAAEWHIPIVEDAAEALGSRLSNGEHPGSVNLAILSFNGNKTITTGGGGALLTNSDEIAARAKHLSTTAKAPHAWRFSHDEIGWNFRMPAINASLGIGQMESLDEILTAKRELYHRYRSAFAASRHFEFLENPEWQEPNNWLIAIRLKHPDEATLDRVLDESHSYGIRCRPVWDLLPLQVPYKQNPSAKLRNAIDIRSSVLCLPSSPKIVLGSGARWLRRAGAYGLL